MIAALNGLIYIGENGALHLWGIKLVGFNAQNGGKFLITFGLIVVLVLLGKLLRLAGRGLNRNHARGAFWYRQGVHVFITLAIVIGIASVWFDDPTRLTTAIGLISAGLAFALQRVVTALAGYVLILRGKTFNVGDRIVMGGVRGDVIALGFMQTTIMEMGQPPPVQNADPAVWVRSRQYTGRIVTISNQKVFDEPVFNYTREFPYIWEELVVPIAYKDDRNRVEQILLDVCSQHTLKIADLGEKVVRTLEERYLTKRSSMEPKVFMRMTDNWVELTARFIAEDHGVRDLKDAITRDVLNALDEAKIGIASATFELTGMPLLRFLAEHSHEDEDKDRVPPRVDRRDTPPDGSRQ